MSDHIATAATMKAPEAMSRLADRHGAEARLRRTAAAAT
jgi:hypothetical protein